jgi:hypothetical protein
MTDETSLSTEADSLVPNKIGKVVSSGSVSITKSTVGQAEAGTRAATVEDETSLQ